MISERAPSSAYPSPQDLPNQRINLHAIHIIQFLQRLLDLPLVRLDITNENQRVILLNLLHRTLRVERVDDDFVVVEARLMRDGFARVFGRPGELERLGSVEGGCQADFSRLFGMGLHVYLV